MYTSKNTELMPHYSYTKKKYLLSSVTKNNTLELVIFNYTIYCATGRDKNGQWYQIIVK